MLTGVSKPLTMGCPCKGMMVLRICQDQRYLYLFSFPLSFLLIKSTNDSVLPTSLQQFKLWVRCSGFESRIFVLKALKSLRRSNHCVFVLQVQHGSELH